ncbi:unnamed protein product [Ectocarpus sp. 4 AP-2014]
MYYEEFLDRFFLLPALTGGDALSPGPLAHATLNRLTSKAQSESDSWRRTTDRHLSKKKLTCTSGQLKNMMLLWSKPPVVRAAKSKTKMPRQHRRCSASALSRPSPVHNPYRTRYACKHPCYISPSLFSLFSWAIKSLDTIISWQRKTTTS